MPHHAHIPAWLKWFDDHRRWRTEAWPVAVYLTDEGLMLEGVDPQWTEVREWLIDQAALTGLTPWQVVTTMVQARRTLGQQPDSS